MYWDFDPYPNGIVGFTPLVIHAAAAGGDAPARAKRQPKNVRAGLIEAAGSLKRGLTSAAHTIVTVPVTEYRRSGPKVCTTAVAVPAF